MYMYVLLYALCPALTLKKPGLLTPSHSGGGGGGGGGSTPPLRILAAERRNLCNLAHTYI